MGQTRNSRCNTLTPNRLFNDCIELTASGLNKKKLDIQGAFFFKGHILSISSTFKIKLHVIQFFRLDIKLKSLLLSVCYSCTASKSCFRYLLVDTYMSVQQNISKQPYILSALHRKKCEI